MRWRTLLRFACRTIAPHWVQNALGRRLWDVERFQRATVLDMPPGRRALVLAPHPDDESIGCGGSIRKYVEAGVPVMVVVLTDGRQGDPAVRQLPPTDPLRMDRETALVTLRQREAASALHVLGVDAHEFLGARDGSLREQVEDLAPRLASILDRWQPDSILLPFLTDRHVDHFAANSCLMAAAAQASGAWKTEAQCLGYEIWSPIYANLLVDVSDTMPLKREAIRCHESQIADADYLAGIEGLNRYRAVSGLATGTHAEAFYAAPFPAYQALYGEMLL